MNRLRLTNVSNGGQEVKVNEQIMLRWTNKAQQRTKNRIRENGQSGFVVILAHTQPRCLKHRPALLLESVDTGWRGWLPCEEVEVVDEHR